MTKKRRRTVPLIIVLAALLLLSFSLVRLYGQIAEAKQTASELHRQVEELTEANEELQSDIDNADDEELIKRIAGTELGLVEPGEKVFYDTSK